MNRKLSWLLIGFMVIGLLLVACAPAPATEEATEEPAQEATEAPTEEMTEAPTEEMTEAPTEEVMTEEGPKTVIIGTTDQISSLDFADAYSVHDWELFRNVNRGLIGFTPGTADITPVLATDFPTVSDDGLTWTFQIDQGWMYPDGTELTANDFVRGITRSMTLEGEVSSLVVPYVDSVEAPDDYTLVIHLKQVRGDFPQIVTGTSYYPVEEGQYPDDALNKFPDTLYGVGPYQVTDYVVNEQVVMDQNPNYKPGFPDGAPERVIIRYFSDPTTMANAVETGEIDVAWRTLGPIEAARLGDVEGLTLYNTGGGGIRYLTPNHTMAPMDSKNVRQALAYLVDRDEIIDRAVQGRNDPLYSQVPPGFVGANEAFLDRYDSPDIAAAEDLLRADGYSEDNPLVFDLWYPPEHYGTYAAQIFQVLKEQFERTPLIQVNLQVQEWSTYVGALTSCQYPIGYLGWFFDYPDTSNYLDPFAQSEASVHNGTCYGSDEMDQLLADGGAESDQEARAQIYEEAQNLYAEDVVTIPLTIETEYAVFNNASIKSVTIGPALVFNYELIEFAQ